MAIINAADYAPRTEFRFSGRHFRIVNKADIVELTSPNAPTWLERSRFKLVGSSIDTGDAQVEIRLPPPPPKGGGYRGPRTKNDTPHIEPRDRLSVFIADNDKGDEAAARYEKWITREA